MLLSYFSGVYSSTLQVWKVLVGNFRRNRKSNFAVDTNAIYWEELAVPQKIASRAHSSSQKWSNMTKMTPLEPFVLLFTQLSSSMCEIYRNIEKYGQMHDTLDF